MPCFNEYIDSTGRYHPCIIHTDLIALTVPNFSPLRAAVRLAVHVKSRVKRLTDSS